MIILASASPRRQELLSIICDNFKIEPSDVDETVDKSVPIESIPEMLALKKAEHIHRNNHYNDIVVGCDTGVFLDDKVLGKPADKSDAFRMLKSLSGRTHKVITGCAILYKHEVITFSQVTKVTFYELSDNEINGYISTNEPMDKAGAYGIQGKGSVLVKEIHGDYFNVVGLPVSLLNKKLKELSL